MPHPLHPPADPDPRTLRFDRRLPLSDQVYLDLRQRIVSLDLPPNAPLSRHELARRYQVSLTPLRDALQRLDEEGLVATYPQSRTVVTRIGVDQVYEAQFLRAAVESEVAARLAEAAAPETLADAAAAQDRLADAQARGAPYEAFIVLDKRFHQELFAAARLSSLAALVDRRCGQLDRIRHLHLRHLEDDKPAMVIQDHAAVLARILAGDGEGARRAMRDHLAGTIRRLDELRRRFADYFA